MGILGNLKDDLLLILKGKKLPQGHVTTRKDGSQWVKKKDEKGGKANWVMVKPPSKKKPAKKKTSSKKKKKQEIKKEWKTESELVNAISEALKKVEMLDFDRGKYQNGVGWNSHDRNVYHSMKHLLDGYREENDLLPNIMIRFLKLANKYRRQTGVISFPAYLKDYESKLEKRKVKVKKELEKLEEDANAKIKETYQGQTIEQITGQKPSDDDRTGREGNGRSGEEDRSGRTDAGQSRTDSEPDGYGRIFGYEKDRYKKDRILIARGHSTVFPDSNFLSEGFNHSLRDHQKDYINLAMSKFADGEKGILNFDGTGAGKTREILGLAKTYQEHNPENKKVLVVTKGKRIIQDSFVKDAEAMGVKINTVYKPAQAQDFDNVHITTYSSFEKLKPMFGEYDLVLFDESHMMKNPTSATSKFGIELIQKTKNVALFSATPVDKVKHLYPISEALEMDIEKIYNYLGYEKGKKSFNTKVRVETVLARIDAFMEQVTRQGLAVKREVPLTNLITTIKTIEFDESFRSQYIDLIKAVDDRIERNPRYTGAGKMQKDRITERAKIKAVMELAKQDIKDGYQVVIFAGTANDAEFENTNEGKDILEGTLKQISERLNESGISHSSVYGGASTDKELAKQKIQIAKFQSGENKILIATPESGGTGISLDDTVGNKPRKMYIMTAPFSSVDFIQMIGRVNRLTTMSRAEAVMLSLGTDSDYWKQGIIATKLKTLGGTVKGDYANLSVHDMEVMGSFEKEEEAIEWAKKKKEENDLNDEKLQAIPLDERSESLSDLDYFRKGSTLETKYKNVKDQFEIPKRSVRNIAEIRSEFDKFGTIVEDCKMQFGNKYRGQELGWIRDHDPGYFSWMMKTAGISIEIYENSQLHKKRQDLIEMKSNLQHNILKLNNQTIILKANTHLRKKELRKII